MQQSPGGKIATINVHTGTALFLFPLLLLLSHVLLLLTSALTKTIRRENSR